MNRMNRSGITFFLTLMLGICIIILGLALAPVVKEFNEDARNTTTQDGAEGLDCSNSSISDFQNAGCITHDIAAATFVGFLIAMGLAVLIGKVIVG